VHLAAFYPLYDQDITPLRVLGSLAGLAAITAACCYFGRSRRYLLTGWLWYLGTMVPVIGLVHVGAQSMADRYAYISFWGLWIIAVWGGRDLWIWLMQSALSRGAVAVVVVVLVSVLGWLTYAQAAKWHDTIMLFEDAVADTEHNWFAHRVLADHYLNQGDYEKCLEHCEHGIACGKQLNRLLSTQGRALFETGQRDLALEKLKQAVEADPEDSLARTNLGWVQNELGQYDAAISQLSAAANLLTPADTAYARQIVYLNWGRALEKTNRFPEALEKYQQALEVDPGNAAVALATGELAMRLGNLELARQCLVNAVALDPKNPAAAIQLGQLHAAHGELDAAEERFKQALTLSPHNPTATLRLVDVLLRANRTDEAIARLTETHDALANVNHPSVKTPDSLILTRLADLLAAGGKHALAIQRYEQALAAWPENPRALNNLAWLLATHSSAPPRDGTRALELAQLACKLVGNSEPSTLGTLAAAYAANGQMSEALETAERAQQLARAAGDQATVKALEAQLRAYRQDRLYLLP
jgi:tetratricopeptide (TPR) repeat protein